MIVAIRREDKNIWEKRTPLTPNDVSELIKSLGVKVLVQPSKIRIFSDDEYEKVGAIIKEDLSEADIIFGVKEVPSEKILPNKTYVIFAHVIKGQKHNMKMLKRLMDLKCNLIDYEKIVDEQGKRLIFFGKYAGYAGLIETFQAFGRKLLKKGIDNPFTYLQQPYHYTSIEEAKYKLAEIGKIISEKGIDRSYAPLTVGYAGYGNVSRGAQEFFDILPHIEISPDELIKDFNKIKNETKRLFKIVFKEEHTVKRKEGEFNLNEYFLYPENYESIFHKYIPYLSILLNCIFWTSKHPRLVSREYLKKNFKDIRKLEVIGDISCDINGAIEITYKATEPDQPCYTYNPMNDSYEDDIQKEGIVVMAIDNLPCEFARESSNEFSSVLKKFIPQILSNHFNKPYSEINLPYPIKTALILHNGELTPNYKYLENFLTGD